MNQNSSKCIDILIIGCGSRGENYASYALKHPDRARVVSNVVSN